MRLIKTEEGKIIIDGEGTAQIFTEANEEWIKIEGFTDDELKNIKIRYFSIICDNQKATIIRNDFFKYQAVKDLEE